MPRFADFISFNFRGHGFQNQSRDPSALVLALVGSLKSPPSWCWWCRWCCVSLTTRQDVFWSHPEAECEILLRTPARSQELQIRNHWGWMTLGYDVREGTMELWSDYWNWWFLGCLWLESSKIPEETPLLFRLGLHSIPSPCLRITCMKRKGSSAHTKHVFEEGSSLKWYHLCMFFLNHTCFLISLFMRIPSVCFERNSWIHVIIRSLPWNFELMSCMSHGFDESENFQDPKFCWGETKFGLACWGTKLFWEANMSEDVFLRDF